MGEIDDGSANGKPSGATRRTPKLARLFGDRPSITNVSRAEFEYCQRTNEPGRQVKPPRRFSRELHQMMLTTYAVRGTDRLSSSFRRRSFFLCKLLLRQPTVILQRVESRKSDLAAETLFLNTREHVSSVHLSLRQPLHADCKSF